MTIEEKRKAIIDFCDSVDCDCEDCIIEKHFPKICEYTSGFDHVCNMTIDKIYKTIFGGEESASPKPTPDNINSPSHYTYGKIECIDFIQDKKLNFCLGNAIKYIVRAGHKHSDSLTDKEKAIEDLKKAMKYLEFEIKEREESK